MNGPYEGSASALGELVGQQGHVESLLVSDGFAVDLDGARRAAVACRDQVGRVEAALESARALARADNFGQCAVGDALSGKFAVKATDGPDSLIGLLTQSRDLLARLALAYDRAAAGYDASETDAAATFHALAERTGG